MNEQPSQVMGVSWRGWGFMLLVGTFCTGFLIDLTAAVVQGREPSQILLTAMIGQAGIAIGFYFGQKKGQPGE